MAMFGGSFNPIHLGHIEIARQVKAAFGLDRVLMMVANDPPHKELEGELSAAERYRMTCLGLEGLEGIEADGLELKRQGKSYTVDTLRQLRRQYPGSELYCVVGADMLLTIHTWNRAEELLRENSFIAVGRPDSGDILQAAEWLKDTYGARIYLPGITGPDISSTMIREAMEAGRSIAGFTAPAVAERIYQRGHYMRPEINAIRERLEEELSPKRYAHTMGVVRMAAELACEYAIDTEKARLGALLHDCAKLPQERQLELAEEYGLDVTGLSPAVMHGPIGAERARREFGIEDGEILCAIACHTLGRRGMSGLDKVVYLADKIEYGRDYPGVEELRAEAGRSLNGAMAASMRRGLAKLASKGVQPSGETLAALEEIERELNEQ